MKQKTLGLFVAGIALFGATAGPASAAKVSVEIEGQNVVQAPTVVDTAASVSKPGGVSCTGAVPFTALEPAVAGDWDGPSFAVTRIKSESWPFASGQPSWSVYVNGQFDNDGGCSHALNDGDKVLFWWSNAFASTGYDEPTLLDAPTSAKPGVAFTVTAKDTTTTFDGNFIGTTTTAPSSGATVTGGTAPVTTGANGTAQVTVAAGPYTLVVKQGNRAPARVAGCASTGSDGFCGTTKVGGTTIATVTPAPAPCVTNGHDGFCGTKDTVPAYAKVTAVSEGKKYAKGKGPRQLGGTVEADGSGIADVRLRLTRNDQGKCSTYDGKTEKFKTIKKCGAERGVWFSVGTSADWSYLLPSKLARGRYVLDVMVVDKAGNKTSQLARGTSRVVFTVA
ncbi:Ig-like domain repeat protein [Baekduia sp. Peel2402]|uniref:Ig-like domain repeat protein n=1 Tax=Baekduia sp. Peel2402 TaxID=3458296 RepID=UPI00403EB7DC